MLDLARDGIPVGVHRLLDCNERTVKLDGDYVELFDAEGEPIMKLRAKPILDLRSDLRAEILSEIAARADAALSHAFSISGMWGERRGREAVQRDLRRLLGVAGD